MKQTDIAALYIYIYIYIYIFSQAHFDSAYMYIMNM